MSQRGENVALSSQAIRKLRAAYPAVRQFESDDAFYGTVSTHGLPDRAHAATADLPNQAVGPNNIALACGRGFRSSGAVGGKLRQCAEEVVSFDACVLPQHVPKRGHQARMRPALRFYPGGTSLCRHVEHLVQEPRQCDEIFLCERHGDSGPGFSLAGQRTAAVEPCPNPCGPSARQFRGCRQSPRP